MTVFDSTRYLPENMSLDVKEYLRIMREERDHPTVDLRNDDDLYDYCRHYIDGHTIEIREATDTASRRDARESREQAWDSIDAELADLGIRVPEKMIRRVHRDAP